MSAKTVSFRIKILGLIIGATASVVVMLVGIYVSEQYAALRETEARLIDDSLKSAEGLAFTLRPHFLENDFVHMNGIAAQYARRAYRSYVVVVDNQDRILAHSARSELGGVFEIPAEHEVENVGEGLFQKYRRGGKLYYDVSYPIKAGDLVIGKVRIGLNTDWIRKEKDAIRKTILEFVGAALAITVVCILAASGMAKMLADPLARLAKIARDVGKGDFTQKVDIKKSGDEVGTLADAFNVMIENLSRARVQLVDKDYLDSIMAAMEDSLIVLTSEGLIATVNNFTLNLLGYERSELVNQPVETIVGEWLFGREETDQSGGAGFAARNFEGAFRTKTGGRIPMLFSVASLGGKFREGLLLVGKDITGRKNAERALAESEAGYRNLFDSSTDGIFILDLEGNFIDANRTAYSRLGYTREELLSMNIAKLDDPSFVGRVPERVRQILEQGVAVFESGHMRKDGSIMPVEVNSRLMEHRGRQILFSVIRDITDRKKAEEALRESERRYHTLFEQSPDGIVLVDLEGKIIDFNESAHRDLGYAREEFSRMGITDIAPWESSEDVKDRIRRMLGEGKADFYAKHKTKQGEIRDVHVITHIIMLSGRPLVHTMWHDITDIENMRGKLEEKTAEQNAILENALVGIALLKDRRFVWINSKMEQMFGYRLSEVSGLTTEAFYPSQDSYEELGKEAYALLAGGETYTLERPMKRKDGSIFWCSLSGKAIDPADPNKGSIWILQDITERKRSDEQLKASLLEKDILLKEIHHRVKNNLQVVSSMLRLQADYVRDKQARMLFDDSRRRVETMSLIHERLYRSSDLAKIDFREYVNDLAANLALINTRRAGRINVGIDVEGIMLDLNNAIPCGLIINELVSNAFKHAFVDGRSGSVKVSMRRMHEKSVMLEVSDDGVGFPAGMDFRNTASLGLQLVNSLVTQLGATIMMDGSKGTAFRIEFSV